MYDLNHDTIDYLMWLILCEYVQNTYVSQIDMMWEDSFAYCHVDSVGEFGSCEKQWVNVSWPQYDMISRIFYMSYLSYKFNFLFIYRRRKT